MERILRRPLEMVIYQLVLGTVMRNSFHLEPPYRWPGFGGKETPGDVPTSLSHYWYQGPDETLKAKDTKRHSTFGAIM